jgi:hypothetical protein
MAGDQEQWGREGTGRAGGDSGWPTTDLAVGVRIPRGTPPTPLVSGPVTGVAERSRIAGLRPNCDHVGGHSEPGCDHRDHNRPFRLAASQRHPARPGTALPSHQTHCLTSHRSDHQVKAKLSQAATQRMRSRWSALGPHGTRNRWSSVGTSGPARRVWIAGHGPSTATTWDGVAAWPRVRIPPPPRLLPRCLH